MNDILFAELVQSVIEGGRILKKETFITLNYRQLAACIWRIGLFNNGGTTLTDIQGWCLGNKLSFNLRGLNERKTLMVTPKTRVHSDIIDLILTQEV